MKRLVIKQSNHRQLYHCYKVRHGKVELLAWFTSGIVEEQDKENKSIKINRILSVKATINVIKDEIKGS